MRAKIGADFLRSEQAKSKEKKFEVCDTELKGFGLIIYPDTKKSDGIVLPGSKVYIVRYRLPCGKQTMKRIGKHTLLKPAEARVEAANILLQVKSGVDPSPKKAIVKNDTFSTFLEKEYQPWAEAHRKDGKATVKRLKSCFADFLNTPLVSITAWNVEKWRTARLKAGTAPATVNRDLVALKAMLSRALDWGRIDVHPLAKVKPSKVDSAGKVRFLDDAEEKRLFKALDDREEKMRQERDSNNKGRKLRGYPLFPDLRAVAFADHLKPMVIVAINTGIRWGELASLTWDDIDFQRAILTVGGDNAKSGKTRHVPLNAVALESLNGWQKQSKGKLIFPSPKGDKADAPMDNVNKAWGAVLTEANISAFRWHDLRHHFASRLIMAGVDLNTVRELLGHSDLKMTLRYAHLAPEHKAAAVAMLVR